MTGPDLRWSTGPDGLAGPDQSRRQRVIVVSPLGRHQVDLPVDVAVAAFLPDLLVGVGLYPALARSDDPDWRLVRADGQVLAPERGLAECGIDAGTVLRLERAPAGRDRGDTGGLPAVRLPSDRPEAGPADRAETRRWSRESGWPSQDDRPGSADRTAQAARAGQQGQPGQARGPGGRPPVWLPDDGLTPLQRTSAVLPAEVAAGRRLTAAIGAFWRGGGATAGTSRPEARSPSYGTGPYSDRQASDSSYPDRPYGDGPSRGRPYSDHAYSHSSHGTGPDGAGPDGAGIPEPRPAGRRGGGVHAAGRGRLVPADLTVSHAPTRAERARAAWRDSDYLGRLDQLIAGPRLRRCATVAVVSPKGGVGKTTVSALLGTLLSLLRRDPVVAVDTNPDFGSLGRVLAPDQSWYVDDLARLIAEQDGLSLTALEARLGPAVHGLLVVPAPTDPVRMAALDERAYRQVITRLKDFFGVIVLDCGTGLQDEASVAAVAASDHVVLITDAQPATASLVAESAGLVLSSGRPMTVVVNRMPARGARLDLARLSHYLPDARGLIVVPDEPAAAARLAAGSFDWRDAPGTWQRAVREVAAVITADWQRIGLAR